VQAGADAHPIAVPQRLALAAPIDPPQRDIAELQPKSEPESKPGADPGPDANADAEGGPQHVTLELA
jgi:hypothetical protein